MLLQFLQINVGVEQTTKKDASVEQTANKDASVEQTTDTDASFEQITDKDASVKQTTDKEVHLTSEVYSTFIMQIMIFIGMRKQISEECLKLLISYNNHGIHVDLLTR